MRRRKSKPSYADRGIYARGWIEPVVGEPIEGLFIAEGFDGEGLQLIVGRELGICPWSDITNVSMMPRTELGQVIQDLHADVFSKSTDPNVFMGWLPDEQIGQKGFNPFVLSPIGEHTWQDWQQVFTRAGL
jgi:hypothetical protein